MVIATRAAWAGAQVGVLMERDGGQLAPSRSGNHVAFLEASGSPPATGLWVADVTDPAAIAYDPIASGGVVGEPRVADGVVVYRKSGVVGLYTVASHANREIAAAGDGQVAASSGLAAWVQDAKGATGEDVAWLARRAALPIVLERSGSQHSVATSFGWVAYIDEAENGAVHLIDTATATTSVAAKAAADAAPVYPGLRGSKGEALEVAIWTADAQVRPTVAVLVDGSTGGEIVIIDAAGATTTLPTATGGKQHLRLFGDWVAYEDLSTGAPWVTLYEYVQDRTFAPPFDAAGQALGSLDGTPSEVRAVWSAPGLAGDEEVWQYRIALPLPADGGGGGGGGGDTSAICASNDPALVDLLVKAGRDGAVVTRSHHDGASDDKDHALDDPAGDHGSDDWHVKDTGAHDERWHADEKWRSFDYDSFVTTGPLRVVVCIDAVDVASAWVGVGSEVVAAPSDFSMPTGALEARLTVPEGLNYAGAVVIANRGGSLRLRVYEDPGGDVDGPPEGSTCNADGDCPSPPHGIGSKLGCGSSGGAGSVISLLLIGLLVARTPRRRT